MPPGRRHSISDYSTPAFIGAVQTAGALRALHHVELRKLQLSAGIAAISRSHAILRRIESKLVHLRLHFSIVVPRSLKHVRCVGIEDTDSTTNARPLKKVRI
jgi:hypothetical protein